MWPRPQVQSVRTKYFLKISVKKKTSREAAAFYMENRYTYYSSCAESCLRMEVEAKFKSKAPSELAKIGVLIPREVMVIQEYYSITLTSTGG